MIPGVTDRKRIPRIGKIRLGEKGTSQGGGLYPKATSYFVMKDAPGLDHLDLGEKPTSFQIRFHTDNLDEVFATSRSAYGKGTGLFCRCSDGETAVRTFVEKDKQAVKFLEDHDIEHPAVGEMFEMPCDGAECPYMMAKRCSNLGRLHFEIIGQGSWGVYEICTTSFHSIVNVGTALAYALEEFGQLRGIPFYLRLIPKEVTPDGKKKTVYVLQLVPPQPELVNAAKAQKRLQPRTAEPPSLEAPDEIPDDLYPNGGETLDHDLDGQTFPVEDDPPHPAESEPPDDGFGSF